MGARQMYFRRKSRLICDVPFRVTVEPGRQGVEFMVRAAEAPVGFLRGDCACERANLKLGLGLGLGLGLELEESTIRDVTIRGPASMQCAASMHNFGSISGPRSPMAEP